MTPVVVGVNHPRKNRCHHSTSASTECVLDHGVEVQSDPSQGLARKR
jgi:hypothetical protein